MEEGIKPEASIKDLERLDLRVGKVVRVEDFPEAKKPAWLLSVDLGPLGIKCSRHEARSRFPAPWTMVERMCSL